jgi:Tol biopolymer transport system component
MIAVNGGRPVQLTHDPAADWYPVWSPDGRHLYFLSNRSGSMNLWRVAVDGDSGRVEDPPEQVTTPSADTLHFSLARDGRSLAYVNQVRTGNIYRVDFDPASEKVLGPPSPVTRGSWRALCPDVSPDGQWVAFTTWTKPENLFVCRVDGSDLRQLTDDEHWDLFPRWSPDGQRLAFMSNRGGVFQIWTIAPDGRSLQQLTHMKGGSVYNSVWSPDGERLAFIASRGENGAIAIMETGRPWAERPLEILPSPEPPEEQFTVFSWSPDGRRLAGNRGGGEGISVYSLYSQRYRNFTEFGRFPRWLSDSQRLIFATPGEPGLYLLDTRTGKVRKILSVAPNGVHLVSPTRDDRRIYFGLGAIEADIWLMSVE